MSLHQKRAYQNNFATVVAAFGLLMIAALYALQLHFQLAIAFFAAAVLVLPVALNVAELRQRKAVKALAVCFLLLGGLLFAQHYLSLPVDAEVVNAPAGYEETPRIIYKRISGGVGEFHRQSDL